MIQFRDSPGWGVGRTPVYPIRAARPLEPLPAARLNTDGAIQTLQRRDGDCATGVTDHGLSCSDDGGQQDCLIGIWKVRGHTVSLHGSTVAYTTVITTIQALLADQESALTLQQNQLVASVTLIAALGGGWDSSALPIGGVMKCIPDAPHPSDMMSGYYFVIEIAAQAWGPASIIMPGYV